MEKFKIYVEENLIDLYKSENFAAADDLYSELEEFLDEFFADTSIDDVDVADPYALFEEKLEKVENFKLTVERHINALRVAKGVNAKFSDEYYLDGYEDFELEVYEAMQAVQGLDNHMPENKNLDAMFIEFLLSANNEIETSNFSYSYPQMLYKFHNICYIYLHTA